MKATIRPPLAALAAFSIIAATAHATPGGLDATFGTGGKVTTPIGSGSDSSYSVAVQPDGKIVVAGFSFDGSNSNFALARYTTTGALDTTFNGTGKVTTDFAGNRDNGYSVAVQADGKIVVAGDSENGGPGDFALVRYTSSGALDTTFNGTGKVTTDFGGTGDYGNSVAVQTDGKILVAGRVDGDGFDFALARYTVALPDTRLGTTSTAPVGNNIYNLTAAGQTLNTAIKRGGGVKTDFLRIQNDGPVLESFKVKGTPGNAKFTVKYLNGTSDVTAKVVAGTFKTGPLNPGASKLLKAVITAKTPLTGQQRNLSILATSASDPTGRDKELIKARSK